MKSVQRLDQDPEISKLNKLSKTWGCRIEIIQYEGKSYPVVKDTNIENVRKIAETWNLEIKFINKNGERHIALVGKDMQ